MDIKIFLSEINWLRYGMGEFRHYRFFGDAA